MRQRAAVLPTLRRGYGQRAAALYRRRLIRPKRRNSWHSHLPTCIHSRVSSVADHSGVLASSATGQRARCVAAVRFGCRKFKPPRRDDVAQWSKVEALVKLGFRFDTIYDADGAVIRYPSSKRGIPAFVNKVARVPEESAHKAARSKAALALRRRKRQTAGTRDTKTR